MVRPAFLVTSAESEDTIAPVVSERTAGAVIMENLADCSESSQILSERNGPTTSDRTLREYVWGLLYIDEILERDRDRDPPNGTLDEKLFYIQDANWNVVTLCSETGAVVERSVYDPYGLPEFRDINWANPSQYSAKYNEVLFTGRSWRGALSYTYDYRHREYSPYLGRFLQRDPIGIWGDPANEGNGYAYCGGSPVVRSDPSGTRTFEVSVRKESVHGSVEYGHSAYPREILEQVEIDTKPRSQDLAHDYGLHPFPCVRPGAPAMTWASVRRSEASAWSPDESTFFWAANVFLYTAHWNRWPYIGGDARAQASAVIKWGATLTNNCCESGKFAVTATAIVFAAGSPFDGYSKPGNIGVDATVFGTRSRYWGKVHGFIFRARASVAIIDVPPGGYGKDIGSIVLGANWVDQSSLAPSNGPNRVMAVSIGVFTVTCLQ
jgi:RHS repeat-associated protein